MPRHTHQRKSLLGKAALATAALGGLLFFAAVPNAQAADRDDGDRRGARAEYRHGAIENHGYYGRESSEWRPRVYERSNRFRSDDDRYREDGRYRRSFDRDRR
jgi:hypothetical protein